MRAHGMVSGVLAGESYEICLGPKALPGDSRIHEGIRATGCVQRVVTMILHKAAAHHPHQCGLTEKGNLLCGNLAGNVEGFYPAEAILTDQQSGGAEALLNTHRSFLTVRRESQDVAGAIHQPIDAQAE